MTEIPPLSLCVRTHCMASLLLLLVLPTTTHAAPAVLAEGLQTPTRLLLLDSGDLLVSESGIADNAGRITRVGRDGQQQQIVEGLPSGVQWNGFRVGPTVLTLERPRRLLVGIATGDVSDVQGPNNTQFANINGPSSPLFSSVIRMILINGQLATLDSPFILDLADHFTISQGNRVIAENDDGVFAIFELVTSIPMAVPDPVTIVRTSTPFGMVVIGRTAYMSDTNRNSIERINLRTGKMRRFLDVPDVENPSDPGVFFEAVPSSLKFVDRKTLLVSLESALFAPGASSIQRLDLETGTLTPVIEGLQNVLDLATIGDPHGAELLVVQLTLNNLLYFEDPSAEPIELIDESLLSFPTSVVFDPQTSEAFVSELGGKIVSVAVP
ncbi:MAG: ScyD/ScyE family protein [Acidobacteriota bacterium]